MNHLIFVRKAYIPNFRPLVPFLHVKKFVWVVGGWVVGVKTWILVLSFRPKLNKNIRFEIKWRLGDIGKPFTPVSNVCTSFLIQN